MAIVLKISHDDRLVLATVGGDARRGDYLKMLHGIAAANAVGYRKIVDIRFVPLDYKIADFRAFGQSIREWGQAGEKPGPTALIAGTEMAQQFAQLFRDHSPADRPLRIFADIPPARAWLDEIAPVRPASLNR
jgi:hypothetical protein